MKKTTIVFLLLALIAGLFISCSQEMTVDADVHNKINDIDTFCINGKYFSTLQAAVDYFKDSKAMKAPGDNDNVIYLTRNASGPGADIVDIQDLVIDFAGFTYSFTNVTAIQGETGGKFGLSITEGSEVTLKGLEQIDLFDSTADLTMVYIEGSGTSLTIEDAPKMVVEPTQYVFWAANGATLTIGSTDATKEAAITGKIAATGGTTEESVPTITVKAKTTITGDVEATKAEVTLSGKTVVTGTVSATESKIEANETSKVTGKIEARASKVSVSGAAKIDVDLTAKDNSEVVINTVEAGAEPSVIKTMDKEETSTVVVAGGTVNVEEVAEGSDDAVEVADGATVTGDDVQTEDVKTYVAKINGKSAYATMEDAIEAASTTGHRDEIILLQAITEDIEIPKNRNVIINLKSYDLGTDTSHISVTVDGSVIVRAESEGEVYVEMHLKSGSDTVLESGEYIIDNPSTAVEEGAELTITGGTYNFDPISFVPAYCDVDGTGPYVVTRIAKNDAVAEISGNYYKDLQVAINDAEDGDTVKLLTDITQDAGFIVDKANMDVSLDLNGKTITVNNGANINNRAFRIDNGILRVSGGSIIAIGSGTTSSDGTGCYGAFRVEKDGILFAENMNLSNARPWGLNVKVLGGEATLTNVTITSSYGGGIEVTEADLGTHSKPGIATLTDCTFNQADYFDHCSTALSVSGGSELIVNSGTYSGEYGLYVFSSGGYITVKDGNFTGKTKNVLVAAIDTGTYPQYIGGFVIEGGSFTGTANITSPATMNITGGEYSFDPSAYVAEGYYAKPQGTEPETWIVIPDTPQVSVVKNGESKGVTMSLASFRDKVNAGNTYEGYTITLLGDVDLENDAWTPIGTFENPFNGTFDGAGHTISNISTTGFSISSKTYYAGFFGYVQGEPNSNYDDYSDIWVNNNFVDTNIKESYYTAVVKNVNIDKATCSSEKKYSAGLVAFGNNVYIENCSVANSTISTGKVAGGIAGTLNGSIVKGCTSNNNTITVTGYHAAGIVGFISYYNHDDEYPDPCLPSAIINSENNSNLVCTNAGGNSGAFAGIVAAINVCQNTDKSTSAVIGCVNNGNISINEDGNKYSQVGGIVGSGQGVSVIANCINRGSISVDSSYSRGGSGSEAQYEWTAGIVAAITGQTTTGTYGLYNCQNLGDVSVRIDSGDAFVSGIVAGLDSGQRQEGVVIDNCQNSGVISCKNNSDENVGKTSTILTNIYVNTSKNVTFKNMNFNDLSELSDAIPKCFTGTYRYQPLVIDSSVSVTDKSGVLEIGAIRGLTAYDGLCSYFKITDSNPTPTGTIRSKYIGIPNAKLSIKEGEEVSCEVLVLNANGMGLYNEGTYNGGIETTGSSITIYNTGILNAYNGNTIVLSGGSGYVEDSGSFDPSFGGYYLDAPGTYTVIGKTPHLLHPNLYNMTNDSYVYTVTQK